MPATLSAIEEAKLGVERAIQSRDATELSGAVAALASIANMPPAKVDPAPIPAGVELQAASEIRSIFISYARADQPWLDRLRIHLAPLERSRRVEIWHDGKIRTGSEWRLDIDAALERASAAILLVTANFMASNFIYENELPPILKRRAAIGLKVYPVIVSNSLFTSDPAVSSLKTFNDPVRPLSSLPHSEVEGELARLAAELWPVVYGDAR